MFDAVLIKELLILGTIVGMLGMGLTLALRSGVVGLSTGQGIRQLAGNLSQTVILITASVVGLALIQWVIGIRLDFPF